jgi:REP element-mobilizing transposase RayT
MYCSGIPIGTISIPKGYPNTGPDFNPGLRNHNIPSYPEGIIEKKNQIRPGIFFKKPDKHNKVFNHQIHFIMASTLTSANIHFVFSTKNRAKSIDGRMKNRLWAFMGGIARNNRMVAHAIGGTNDHVHMLITLPPTMSIAKAMQLIKRGSSQWIHQEFPEKSDFAWQAGYGAFSVGVTRFPIIKNYINKQEEHHQKRTFQQEYIEFLQVNGVEFDERYVWG